MHKNNLQPALLPFALALAVLTPACAQKQTPPPGDPPKAFTIPAHETYTLPNGLKVTLVPYGNIPKATINVTVNAGVIDEGKDHGGVAGLTANLLNEGTLTLTSQQLADKAASMGSTLSINSDSDQSSAQLDVLSEFTPDAVSLIADVLEHPRSPSQSSRVSKATPSARLHSTPRAPRSSPRCASEKSSSAIILTRSSSLLKPT